MHNKVQCWFNSMKEKSSSHVMDGSDLIELVEEDNKVSTNFVDNKSQDLDDIDCDRKLQFDQIYTEVLSESISGKQDKTSKIESKEALLDFLKGMASGLKHDPVVILRIDGEDLQEFVQSPTFEPEMLSIFSEIELTNGSLKDFIIKAFEKLTVDQGMPPASDPWVMCNILEPALESLGGSLQQPVSQETFLIEFKGVAENVVQLLKDQPAIVAHSQHTFDGSGVKRLLSNKFELDKMLDSALKGIKRDLGGNISKEYLNAALNTLASSAGLPPFGAIEQMDCIMTEALKKNGVGDGKTVKEEELKKILSEVLGSIMVQLEGKLVSVSINTVVHEPLASSSTPLQQQPISP